jgi:hypothetical protein
VPRQYARVVAVDYSPDGSFAVVLVEYNEPPAVEQYVVLCESTGSGWVERQGGAGGGLSWMATSPEADVGVEVAWGQQPTVRWNVPGGYGPEPPSPT